MTQSGHGAPGGTYVKLCIVVTAPGGDMRRRKFISLLGGAAAWPLVARAQQPTMPVIGFLSGASTPKEGLAAFQKGLREAGYIEGKNVMIEYRSATGQYDQLPALAVDLVHHQVAVIAAVNTSAPGLAAKSATSNIPIVFQTGGDPVQDGLVTRMNRPGGNVTGVSRLSVALEPKRLELLHDLVPRAGVIGFLVNPLNPRTQLLVPQMRERAKSLGLSLNVLEASTEAELDSVFASSSQHAVDALLVAQEPTYNRWYEHIVSLAERHKVPAVYASHIYAEAGGLMTYDASVADSMRQVGVYVGRILKGEKPADMPIVQPTKFELAINLKTAKRSA
jgi:putative tryptophan/tyrosine transport system substrate-binding protein